MKSQEKVVKILKKIDDALSKKGLFDYQKRIHRICKVMLSVVNHEECIVSNFILDDHDQNKCNKGNFESEDEEDIDNKCKYNYKEEDETIVDSEIDDILSFIENELHLNKLFSIQDTISTDDDCKSKISPKKRKSLQKGETEFENKFSNIESKLRSYLRESTMFENINFNSCFNGPKNRTPLSKVKVNQQSMPLIIKNFFQDKTIVEEAKKRFSMKEESLRMNIAQLGNLNSGDLFKCHSYMIKLSNTKTPVEREENKNQITKFSVDEDDVQMDNDDEIDEIKNAKNVLYNINFVKRNSIFRENNTYNFGIVPNRIQEISSDSSKQSEYDSSEESDSEGISDEDYNF